MNDASGYIVFFFPQALEVLGEPIKPYLLGTPGNEHVLCREVDTGGALIEMTLSGQTQDGKPVQIELMVPNSMVRMIVSAHGDEHFGFRPRFGVEAAAQSLPPGGATGAPAQAPSEAAPAAKGTPAQTPPKP